MYMYQEIDPAIWKMSYVAVLACWCVLLLLWIWNWMKYRKDVINLHSVATLLLLSKASRVVLSIPIVDWLASSSDLLVGLLPTIRASVNILNNGVFYGFFLLASKGYGITRSVISKNEWKTVIFISATLSILFAFFITFEALNQGLYFIASFVFMRAVFTGMDITANTLLVDRRSMNLNQFYIPLSDTIDKKIRFFRSLKICLLLWLLSCFVLQSLNFVTLSDANGFSLEESLTSFSIYVIIAWLLRLRDFSQTVFVPDLPRQNLNNLIFGLMNHGLFNIQDLITASTGNLAMRMDGQPEDLQSVVAKYNWYVMHRPGHDEIKPLGSSVCLAIQEQELLASPPTGVIAKKG